MSATDNLFAMAGRPFSIFPSCSLEDQAHLSHGLSSASRGEEPRQVKRAAQETFEGDNRPGRSVIRRHVKTGRV